MTLRWRGRGSGAACGVTVADIERLARENERLERKIEAMEQERKVHTFAAEKWRDKLFIHEAHHHPEFNNTKALTHKSKGFNIQDVDYTFFGGWQKYLGWARCDSCQEYATGVVELNTSLILDDPDNADRKKAFLICQKCADTLTEVHKLGRQHMIEERISLYPTLTTAGGASV